MSARSTRSALTLAQLESVAVPTSVDNGTRPTPASSSPALSRKGESLVECCDRIGLAIGTGSVESDGRTKFSLVNGCPFNPEHEGAAVFEWPSGERGFHCFHKSCSTQEWHNVRELFDPKYAERRARERESASVGQTSCLWTDDGIAQEFIAAHGSGYSYDSGTGWWHFTGTHWREAETCSLTELVVKLVRDVMAREIQNGGDAKRIGASGNRFLHSSRIDGVLKVAQGRMLVDHAEWDRHASKLSCANGTLNLDTGELGPHDHADRITRFIDIPYDADARSDEWEKFLLESAGGDTELVAFLQRAVGYSLAATPTEEVFFFVHGPEASGKSTFIETIKAAFGPLTRTLNFETLLETRRDGASHSEDIARLDGARIAVSNEVKDGVRLAEGLVQKLTGGDTIAARRPYGRTFEFTPRFVLWLVANHAPHINEDAGAMWRRILRVPFVHTVPAARRDPKLKTRLKNLKRTGPAILAWAVRGCLDWKSSGLAAPDCVRVSTEAYRAENDTLRRFFDDRCVFDVEAWTPAGLFHSEYRAWCQDSGERGTHDAKRIAARLGQLGCTKRDKRVSGKYTRGWLGVGLLVEEPTSTPATPATPVPTLSKDFPITRESLETDVADVADVDTGAESRAGLRVSPSVVPLGSGLGLGLGLELDTLTVDSARCEICTDHRPCACGNLR